MSDQVNGQELNGLQLCGLTFFQRMDANHQIHIERFVRLDVF